MPTSFHTQPGSPVGPCTEIEEAEGTPWAEATAGCAFPCRPPPSSLRSCWEADSSSLQVSDVVVAAAHWLLAPWLRR